MRAPHGIGPGKVKVTVTFSDWKDREVIPGVFAVEQGPNSPAPYESAKGKEKDVRPR